MNKTNNNFQNKKPYDIEKRYDTILDEVAETVNGWVTGTSIDSIHQQKKAFETKNFDELFRSGVVSSCGYGSENPTCVFVSETPKFIFKKKQKKRKDDFELLIAENESQPQEEEEEDLDEVQPTVDERYVEIFDECLLLESLQKKKRFLHYFSLPLSKDFTPSTLVYELFLHFFIKEIELLKPKVVFVYSFLLSGFLRSRPQGTPYGFTSFFKETYYVCKTPNGHSFFLEFIKNPYRIVYPDLSLKPDEVTEIRNDYVKSIRTSIGRHTKMIISDNYVRDKEGKPIESFGKKVIDISDIIKKNNQELMKKESERKSRLIKEKENRTLAKKNSIGKGTELTKFFGNFTTISSTRRGEVTKKSKIEE